MSLGLTYLYVYGLETVVIVECGAAIGLAGQIDAGGTVQLLQLVVTTLFLDHPAGRAEAAPGLSGGAQLRTETQGERRCLLE